MRELRFRAWDKHKNYMTEGSVGRDALITFDGRVLENRKSIADNDVTDDVILMQYTGLKDKNGKEIYEGDLLVVPGGELKIEIAFRDGAFGYEISGDFVKHNNLGEFLSKYEVIGNIYENESAQDEGRKG